MKAPKRVPRSVIKAYNAMTPELAGVEVQLVKKGVIEIVEDEPCHQTAEA